MEQVRVFICNRVGLHVRPAAELVKVASRFASRITLAMGDLEVDGKSIMGVMMLAAPPGSELIVRTQGPDEREALEALVKLINDRFGEEQ